jgi:hypothetical protein
MRTFLLFLPFLLLRNELLVGVLVLLFCNRDSDDVDDEKEEVGVAALLRRGNELVFREPSLTFNFTLNIFSGVKPSFFFYLLVFVYGVELSSFFQCQQVSASFDCLDLNEKYEIDLRPLESF